jgi:hypothetical protein
LRLFLERHRARSGNPRQGYILQSPQGKPLNLDPGKGRDPAGIRSRKATVVWVARFSTRLGHEPQPAGSPRQGHPANPAARGCYDHDEHLREDGFAGRHAAMKTLETNCAATVQQKTSARGTARTSRWCAVEHRVIDWASAPLQRGVRNSNYDRSCGPKRRVGRIENF